MDPERLKPITLPARWNARRDFAYFDERWDPKPNYTEALWRVLDFHFHGFVSALDGCLLYFQAKHFVGSRILPRCLTPAEKVELLREATRHRPGLAAYRERLLDDLMACHFAEQERQRILHEHRLAGEAAWLYPVVELIDYLGGAGCYLDETLCCEAEDYRTVIQDLSGTNGPDPRL